MGSLVNPINPQFPPASTPKDEDVTVNAMGDFIPLLECEPLRVLEVVAELYLLHENTWASPVPPAPMNIGIH